MLWKTVVEQHHVKSSRQSYKVTLFHIFCHLVVAIEKVEKENSTRKDDELCRSVTFMFDLCCLCIFQRKLICVTLKNRRGRSIECSHYFYPLVNPEEINYLLDFIYCIDIFHSHPRHQNQIKIKRQALQTYKKNSFRQIDLKISPHRWFSFS